MDSSLPAPTSVADRRARGALARIQTPPDLQSQWEPAADRPDSVALLEKQSATREHALVPVRYARMMVSPFTFYCGGAQIMANDLAATPTAGLMTQLCGDAHILNFGVYIAPEGHRVFDFSEFDETLPGPFEYDVKRLATSVTVAARHTGMSSDQCRTVTSTMVHAYRTAIARSARMGLLELWYSRIPDNEIAAAWDTLAGQSGAGTRRREYPEEIVDRDSDGRGVWRTLAAHQARGRGSQQIGAEFAELAGGRDLSIGRSPTTGSTRDRTPRQVSSREEVIKAVHEQIQEFRATLRAERRHLIEGFRVVDVAPGGGSINSIGTRAFNVLMQGRDERDIVLLQLKQATASVLEDHLPHSSYRNAGERVVRGQRIMQTAYDIFLGWTKGLRTKRIYYVRQLWEGNEIAAVDTMPAVLMDRYAGLCGRALARAHARSGDPVAIDAYLGEHDDFDHAIAEFSRRYADQNERDFQAFIDAARSGRVAVDDATRR